MTVSSAADSSSFILSPLDPALAEELSRWRYEPPFDFYNWSSWEVMQQLGLEFGDADIRLRQYAAVRNADGLFVGFAQFFSLLGVIRLGLGLRPDLCGLGMGLRFVQAIVEEALRRAPGDEIDLEVHVWNSRAIRTYEKAGFVITDTYERTAGAATVEVHCMSWLPSRTK